MIFTARFAGKVAAVTGAAQGIGASAAIRMAHEGGRLALVDRSPLAEEVQREAEAAGAEAIAIIADLEIYAGATAAMRDARERHGGVDIVVNNVGGTIWAKPYAEYAEAQIEAEIRRSLFPTLWCWRAALPAMPDVRAAAKAGEGAEIVDGLTGQVIERYPPQRSSDLVRTRRAAGFRPPPTLPTDTVAQSWQSSPPDADARCR